MPVVQLNEISLIYDTTRVLDDISFSIAEGEYVVILGASGCGKTSLLRMIAGLIRPTSGKIFLAGRDVNGIAPRYRDVAFVPQHAGIYPHLSVRKSIGMGVRGRLSRPERERRVHDAAKIVEMESLLDRLPESLSGGQLRRAAVAKAIACRASVRLLDEPLSAIDANLRYQIEQDLLRLHNATPGVTIHVTHDAAEAMRLAGRVAVIEDCKIVQFDKPDRLRTNPVTPGVASILGRSRFLTVQLRRGEETWISDSGQQVSGPDAPTGTFATLGYYEDDSSVLRTTAEHVVQQRASVDWIDDVRNVFVPRDRLFWFLE